MLLTWLLPVRGQCHACPVIMMQGCCSMAKIDLTSDTKLFRGIVCQGWRSVAGQWRTIIFQVKGTVSG